MDKLFGLNGLLGFLILVAVLLSVVAGLGLQAWKTQRFQATQNYTLDTQALEAKNPQNRQYYKLMK